MTTITQSQKKNWLWSTDCVRTYRKQLRRTTKYTKWRRTIIGICFWNFHVVFTLWCAHIKDSEIWGCNRNLCDRWARSYDDLVGTRAGAMDLCVVVRMKVLSIMLYGVRCCACCIIFIIDKQQSSTETNNRHTQIQHTHALERRQIYRRRTNMLYVQAACALRLNYTELNRRLNARRTSDIIKQKLVVNLEFSTLTLSAAAAAAAAAVAASTASASAMFARIAYRCRRIQFRRVFDIKHTYIRTNSCARAQARSCKRNARCGWWN